MISINHTLSPFFTVFNRKDATPADGCEQAGNACLSFLHAVVGRRTVVIYKTDAYLQTNPSTAKAALVAGIIFAILLMPITLIGLCLIKLSKTHRQAFSSLTLKPQLQPSAAPQAHLSAMPQVHDDSKKPESQPSAPQAHKDSNPKVAHGPVPPVAILKPKPIVIDSGTPPIVQPLTGSLKQQPEPADVAPSTKKQKGSSTPLPNDLMKQIRRNLQPEHRTKLKTLRINGILNKGKVALLTLMLPPKAGAVISQLAAAKTLTVKLLKEQSNQELSQLITIVHNVISPRTAENCGSQIRNLVRTTTPQVGESIPKQIGIILNGIDSNYGKIANLKTMLLTGSKEVDHICALATRCTTDDYVCALATRCSTDDYAHIAFKVFEDLKSDLWIETVSAFLIRGCISEKCIESILKEFCNILNVENEDRWKLSLNNALMEFLSEKEPMLCEQIISILLKNLDAAHTRHQKPNSADASSTGTLKSRLSWHDLSPALDQIINASQNNPSYQTALKKYVEEDTIVANMLSRKGIRRPSIS